MSDARSSSLAAIHGVLRGRIRIADDFDDLPEDIASRRRSARGEADDRAAASDAAQAPQAATLMHQHGA